MNITDMYQRVQKYTDNIISFIPNDKVRVALSALDLGFTIYEDYQESALNKNKCTIFIGAETNAFYAIKHDVLSNSVIPNSRQIELNTTSIELEDPMEEAVFENNSKISVYTGIPFYLGSSTNVIYHNIPITVSYNIITSFDGAMISAGYDEANVKKLIITCKNMADRQRVENYFREAINKFYAMGTRTMHVSQLGTMPTTSLGERPLDSIILPQEQKERIFSTIDAFIETKSKYITMGLPYHLGILFEGPPGTGKTTLAKAVAAYLKRDLFVVSTSSYHDDAHFTKSITSLPSGGVIVFEDIDTSKATKRTEDKEKGGVTLSGLLNTLDGILTPDDTIFILTTNDIDEIDEAVYRPGRVDLIEHIGYVSKEQFDAFCSYFGDGSISTPEAFTESMKITPSEIMQCLRDSMHSPENTQNKLNELVESKNGHN